MWNPIDGATKVLFDNACEICYCIHMKTNHSEYAAIQYEKKPWSGNDTINVCSQWSKI